MSAANPKEDLTNLFKTKTQAEDFSRRIGRVTQKVYETDFDLGKALLEEVGPKIRDEFMIILMNNHIDPANRASLKKFMESLREDIKNMEVLGLTLAFQPKEHTLSLISDWLMLNLGSQVLLDIKVDPDLVAGVAVDFRGKHTENSIKAKINSTLEEIFNTKAADLPNKPDPQKPIIHQNAEDMSMGR